MRHFLLISALVGGILLQFPSPARGQSGCTDRTSAIVHLLNKYNEQVIGQGIAANGNLFEITVNEKSGTWSIIYTTPSGMTCIVAGGEDWEEVNTDPILGEDS